MRVLARVGRGLAQAVEAGALDTPETEALLRECLVPMIEEEVDHLVLGCTHYPFLAPVIARVIGPAVTIVDPSPAVARQAGRVLAQRMLENSRDRTGCHRFYTSGDAHAFAAMLTRLIPDHAPRAEVWEVRWREGRLQQDQEKAMRQAG